MELTQQEQDYTETLLNFVELADRLEIWREQRHLSIEMQKAGLLANLMEEAVEYMRASNDNEKVDALCDIIVFVLNAYEFDTIKRIDCNKMLASADNFMLQKHTSIVEGEVAEIDFTIERHFSRLLNDIRLLYISHIIDKQDINKPCLIGIVGNVLAMIRKLGFDPMIAMHETLKEIGSRAGTYDKTIGKWVKDTSKEAKTKWYKADYNKAKEVKNGKR